MCAGCFTTAEAVVVQGVVGVMLTRTGLSRLMQRLTGQSSFERRSAAYQANAEFLAGMDLDPESVLGPPPAAQPDILPRAQRGTQPGAVWVGARVRRSTASATVAQAGAGA